MEELKLTKAILSNQGEKEIAPAQMPAEIYQLSGPSEVVSGVSFVEANPSNSIPETVYVTEALPDGYTMAFEDNGQQYVTIMQDHHTFAIPLAEYQAIQQGGETTITIQTQSDVGGHNDYYEATQIVSLPPDTTIMTDHSSSTDKKDNLMWQSHQNVQTQEHVLHVQDQSSLQTLDLQQPSLPNKLPPNKRLLAQPQYQQPPGSYQVQLGSNHAQTSSKSILSPTSQPLTVQTAGLLEKFSASSVSDLDTRPFKAIQVENWGIYLLGRFMNFYQKKEQCDLTLRFPSKNAQIFVHKIVINSCTDYFLKCEQNGLIVNGAIDMPDDFAPDSVAAIIRFLYTGRLDVKPGMFSNIYNAALKLQLFVLMRLMDAQAESTTNSSPSKNLKRRMSNDPVSQIKKIKKVERKFSAEEKRQRLNLAKEEEIKTNSIPGKKLPIWRRKAPDWCGNQVSNSTQKMDSTSIKTIPSPSGTGQLEAAKASENLKSGLKKGSLSSSIKAYGKVPDTSKSKMLTKQINELQTNLTFEKVRNAGIKNSSKSGTDEPVKDMTVDEIKAFMDEQRKRFAESGENIYDDDDYYDNDAEMDYGDDPGDDDDTFNISLVEPLTVKPILKTPKKQDSVQNKSVRFSLSNDQCPKSNENITRPEPGPSIDEKVEQSVTKELPECPTSSIKTIESEAATPKQDESQEKKSSTPSQPPGQPDMNAINEILKQHPELLKENGTVRVKLKTVNANGKSVIKTFSLRAQNPLPKPTAKPQQVSGPTIGVRETPKVCYTGKRGRPKKVKPGEVDPHEFERLEINQRLRPTLTSSAKTHTPIRNLRRLNYDSESLKNSAETTTEFEAQNGNLSFQLSDHHQSNFVGNQSESPNKKLPASVKALSMDWDDDGDD